jgi:hypothetical protein
MLVDTFVKEHPTSPSVAQLDESEWLAVQHATGSGHMRMYIENFRNGRHRPDIDRIKAAALEYLRHHSDSTAARWYLTCFFDEMSALQLDEMRNIFLTALQKEHAWNTLSPPIPIVQRLWQQPNLTYSIDGIADRHDESKVQWQISSFCDLFHIAQAQEVSNNGLIAIKLVWGKGSHVYENPKSSRNEHAKSESSDTLKADVQVNLDKETSWSASKTFETPADLQVNGSHSDVPFLIQYATLNEFTNYGIFNYGNADNFDYNKLLAQQTSPD